MTHLYRHLALSSAWYARTARGLYRAAFNASLPAWIGWPVIPFFLLYRSLHFAYICLFRVFVAEPVFRYYCHGIGKNFHASGRVPAIYGKGRIVIGDNVRIDGRIQVFFAVRYAEMPTLEIGGNTAIGHDCVFTVGKSIRIGRHCRLGSHVVFFDSPGHPADPENRKAGQPAAQEDVRPIVVGDNVWLGSDAVVYPGVTIGGNSIVALGAVVVHDVAPDVIVAGNPARVVSKIPRAETVSA